MIAGAAADGNVAATSADKKYSAILNNNNNNLMGPYGPASAAAAAGLGLTSAIRKYTDYAAYNAAAYGTAGGGGSPSLSSSHQQGYNDPFSHASAGNTGGGIDPQGNLFFFCSCNATYH